MRMWTRFHLGQNVGRRVWARCGRLIVRIRPERGQSLALLALLLPALVGVLGLAIDGSYGYAVHRKMQTAADAAALAGAQAMALEQGATAATERMERLLDANGADGATSTTAIDVGDKEASVIARTTSATPFLAWFGVEGFPVAAKAVAAWGSLEGAGGLMPFAVVDDVWSPGSTVTLNPQTKQGTGPGNWAWLQWSNQTPDQQNLVDNINDPSRADYLFVGSGVQGNTGNYLNNPSVVTALEAWEGKTLTFALYDPEMVSQQGQNFTYEVSGFARFILTDVDSRRNVIEGTFVDYPFLGGTVKKSGDGGLQGVVLVE